MLDYGYAVNRHIEYTSQAHLLERELDELYDAYYNTSDADEASEIMLDIEWRQNEIDRLYGKANNLGIEYQAC